MKRLYLMVLIVGIIFLFQQAAFGADKIGVVDMQDFQKKSKAFKVHAEKLKKKFEALQKKLQNEKDKLKDAEEEFRKQMMMLSLDARDDKRRDLEKMERRYKYLVGEYSQEMKDAEADATRLVGMEVGKVVGKIGKEKGYTIIIEKRALGLIYWDNAIDITDQVIAEYDKANQ